jgi:hypothetical protein
MDMKAVLAVMVLAASALAQGPPFLLAPSCGPKGINFSVKLDKTKSTPGQPKPGKALVYFIQDDGPLGAEEHFTVKIGIDGAWVGAYKNNSYFSVSVKPGEHHACANIQSNSSVDGLVALGHFTAELGKVYYFRTRMLDEEHRVLNPDPPILDLNSLDSDEAKYLITYYPVSVSRARK